jgi:uncharacterized protein (UPF0332 family)
MSLGSFVVPDLKPFPSVFLTYKNYIRHINTLLDLNSPYSELPLPKKNHEEILIARKQTEAFLRQMSKIKDDSELLPLFTIGAYYVIYFSTCKFLLSTNTDVQSKHSPLMKSLSNTIKQRSDLLPAPLNILFDMKNGVYLNVPVKYREFKTVKFNLTMDSSPEMAWAAYQVLLRTTAEKSKKPFVSFMDFFYRLRKRTNYKDLDPFVTASQDDPSGSLTFMSDLMNITEKISNILLNNPAASSTLSLSTVHGSQSMNF